MSVRAYLTKFIDAHAVVPGPSCRFRASGDCDPPRGGPAARPGAEGNRGMVAEKRKVSIDESYEDGLVSARLDRRVLSILASTQSLVFGTSFHRRREWKTRHATINRCDLTTRCRTAWRTIETFVHDTNYRARDKSVKSKGIRFFFSSMRSFQ